MIVYLVALFIICVIGIKKKKGDYLSQKQTSNIRGVFAALIFFSHLKQYLVFTSTIDLLYSSILAYIGQLMVVIFFFYSGYGILLSYDKKENYEVGFFKNRIIKTWLHFVFAVIIYLLVNLLLGISYSASTTFLSFVGWESIGNSNWFIFDTLILYICAMFSFKITRMMRSKNKIKTTVVLVSVATCVFIFGLRLLKESWWYDTLLGFPCGAVYYLLKEKIDKILEKKLFYAFIGLALLLLFIVLYQIENSFIYNLCSCVFCLIICWVTYKLEIGNPVLSWLGKYSFYIYIYMRLPMIILEHYKINQNIYLYSILSLLGTISLARIMFVIQEKVDVILLGKGNNCK